jgi:hypothetical protein
MAIESLVRKKYFLTSEQSKRFASLSPNILYWKFFNLFLKYFLHINN